MGESFVIDANIVKAVFEVSMGHAVTVSADPAPVMDALKEELCRIVLDEGQQILQEWRDCVDPEWFEDWFYVFVSEWNVAYIVPKLCNEVLKKLRTDCGFPKNENKCQKMRTSGWFALRLLKQAQRGHARSSRRTWIFGSPARRTQKAGKSIWKV
jgi:hypothetical protein